MIAEILQALVNVSRGLIWKILPKSISQKVDPDSPMGDSISVVIILLVIIIAAYFLIYFGDQSALSNAQGN